MHALHTHHIHSCTPFNLGPTRSCAESPRAAQALQWSSLARRTQRCACRRQPAHTPSHPTHLLCVRSRSVHDSDCMYRIDGRLVSTLCRLAHFESRPCASHRQPANPRLSSDAASVSRGSLAVAPVCVLPCHCCPATPCRLRLSASSACLSLSPRAWPEALTQRVILCCLRRLQALLCRAATQSSCQRRSHVSRCKAPPQPAAVSRLGGLAFDVGGAGSQNRELSRGWTSWHTKWSAIVVCDRGLRSWSAIARKHAAMRRGLSHMLNRHLSRGWGAAWRFSARARLYCAVSEPTGACTDACTDACTSVKALDLAISHAAQIL
jgi:hypothetical protein